MRCLTVCATAGCACNTNPVAISSTLYAWWVAHSLPVINLMLCQQNILEQKNQKADKVTYVLRITRCRGAVMCEAAAGLAFCW